MNVYDFVENVILMNNIYSNISEPCDSTNESNVSKVEDEQILTVTHDSNEKRLIDKISDHKDKYRKIKIDYLDRLSHDTSLYKNPLMDIITEIQQKLGKFLQDQSISQEQYELIKYHAEFIQNILKNIGSTQQARSPKV